MFFMARGYHSFTVSVRVATTRVEEHVRNNSGSLGEAVATPDLSYASAGFQPASQPCAGDRKGDDGRGAMSLAGRTADAMDLGPVPTLTRAQGISLHFRSARRRAARDRGTGGDAG
jgi:hypothetical protein